MSSSRSPSTSHRISSSLDVSSRSTSTYGQVIERPFRLPSILSERSAAPPSPSPMSPSTSSSQSIIDSLTDTQSQSGSHSTSHPESMSPPIGDAFDPIRDQVAHTIVLRALRKAELIDGTKVGVVLTLPHQDGEQFLKLIASRLKRAMLPKQESYLFILALPLPGRLSPTLICSSSETLSERAGLVLGAKFMNRIERQETRHGRWGALVRDLCATTYDEAAFWDAARKAARRPIDPLVPPPGSRSVSQVLDHARARLQRITPRQAFAELRDSTAAPWPVVLVDIRPEAQRRTYGGIAGALVVERNVLEWRFDPRSAARLAIADRYDLRVIVFCQEGYTSSLAAAALHDLGMLNATDMIGGHAAWKEAGLPDEVEVSSTAPPTEGRVSVPVEEEH